LQSGGTAIYTPMENNNTKERKLIADPTRRDRECGTAGPSYTVSAQIYLSSTKYKQIKKPSFIFFSFSFPSKLRKNKEIEEKARGRETRYTFRQVDELSNGRGQTGRKQVGTACNTFLKIYLFPFSTNCLFLLFSSLRPSYLDFLKQHRSSIHIFFFFVIV
jgi:hypothetical protein